MGFFNQLFGGEKQQTLFDRAQELSGVLIVAGYREIARQTGSAPTSKTSDDEIIAIYTKVGTAFHKAAAEKGERLSAGIKNRIVLFFLQIKETHGAKFADEHLEYEIQKYLRESLREDYKKDPIDLISILGLDQNQQDYQAMRVAASNGNSQAQFNLGALYSTGKGVPQDYAQAVQWFRKAAEQGNADAQYNLGGMYENGIGVSQDYAQAAQWYRKAADQGDVMAQGKLGWMYANGIAVPLDYTQAAQWLRKAADQGDAEAQFKLAFLYSQGQGVQQDVKLALRLFQLAADQGHTKAQHVLSTTLSN